MFRYNADFGDDLPERLFLIVGNDFRIWSYTFYEVTRVKLRALNTRVEISV